MKKMLVALFVLTFTIAVLTACSYSNNNPSTSQSSTSSQISLSQQASMDEKTPNEEMVLTENQLYFWKSEYGKGILDWCDEPNLYIKVLNKDLILYYCEGAVYIKTENGIIDEVIDQISINPELIRFDGSKLYIPFESGIWGYGIGNFPYSYVYDIQNCTSYKKMWALNTTSGYHCVIGATPEEGKIGIVEVHENCADIYFDIDLEKQTNGLDNYFPRINFFYNDYNKTAYYYINGINPDIEKIKALEKIEGLEQIKSCAFETEDGFSGTIISFVVKNEYTLYSEIITGFETTPADHLSIWVVKK